MGGLVIDIYIGFLVRWLVLVWRKTESSEWPTVAGTIVRCHFEECGYGGDYVVLSYKYKVDCERFHGEMRKPYMYANYAEAFVRHHPEESELRIHVDPKNPMRSFPVTGR
jgi:hypothetical protein